MREARNSTQFAIYNANTRISVNLSRNLVPQGNGHIDKEFHKELNKANREIQHTFVEMWLYDRLNSS